MKLPITLMCVQPSLIYYAWQIEVMLTNFKELGIHKHFDIQCLFAYNTKESDWKEKVDTIKKVENSMSDVAKFYYYQDTRVYPISYISSIRPNVLKQHFKEYPKLSNEAVFYHDCDIVFTKFPDFLYELNLNDNNWYVSDTISYIGYNYIASKGEDVIDKMCEIVGINKELVKSRESQSGGAQYLIKKLDWVFFDKMEKDSERLFKEITELNKKKVDEDSKHHPLQIWCSDMWAILWGAWMRGYNTNILKEMQFCWATDAGTKWNETYIYHNAGVTASNTKLFNKTLFRDKYPYLEDGENYDKNSASYKYFSIINKIGKNSCLIEDKEVEPSDISTIFNDYLKDISPSEEVKNAAFQRLSICYSCPNWNSTATGSKVCKLCGCKTISKIFSPLGTNECPIQKWTI